MRSTQPTICRKGENHHKKQQQQQQQQHGGNHGRRILLPTVPSASLALLIVFSLAAIGVVSPFAGGSTADVGNSQLSSSSSPLHQSRRQLPFGQTPIAPLPSSSTTALSAASSKLSSSSSSSSPLFRPLPPTTPYPGTLSSSSGSNNVHVKSGAGTAASSSALFATSSTSPVATNPIPDTTQQKTTTTTARSRFKNILYNMNPFPGRVDGRWKGGESSATLASRLLFSYVSPLLDVAKERPLLDDDSFTLVDRLKMEYAVPSLTDTYDVARKQAHKSIELKRQQQQSQQRSNINNGLDGDTNNNNNNNSSSNSSGSGSSYAIKNSQSLILLKALVRYQKGTLVYTGLMRFLNTAIQAFPAILVAKLLRAIEAGPANPIETSLRAAFLLVSVLSLKMIVENQFFHGVVTMSTQIRGALEGLIFDKSLRLPEGGSSILARRDVDKQRVALGSGGVLNLMQSDASIIESAAMQVHTIWDGPLQIGMYTYLLFKYLGPSVLWGLAVLLTVIPLNSITLRILDRLARSENEAKSARTRRTNESITHMKLLKLSAWEKIFASDVDRHRRDELHRHKSRGVVRAINSAVSNAVPALVLVVTLAAYAKTGKPIVASTIFTAISLFNQLRFPLFFYPMLIDSLANGKNAMRRISSYLTSEELTPYVQYLPPTDDGGGKIEMKHGSFLWSTSQEPKDGEVAPPEAPALCDVNLVVNPGEVVAVVGPVGSGKSALVKGLLGELAPVPKIVVDGKTGVISDSTDAEQLMIKPTVVMNGNIGYASQEAWLPKGTLRDAVVFGRDFDDKRYKQALYDAGLDQDIANGTLNSDMDVGEKGSNLSGGQRARVALARAMYSGEDTKVFLLDDCLAALDARVGALVFERVTKRLKASKAATILVTNDPNLPRRCDRVVLMGPTGATKKRPNSISTCSTIIDSGTYDKLLDRGHKLQSISSIDRSHDGEIMPSSGDYHDMRENEVMIESREVRPGSIRVVGGYKVMTNDTDCSCHADPEVSQIDVQNNPDFIADRVIPRNLDDAAEDFFVENTDTILNSTASSPAPNAPPKAVGLISTDDKMTTQAVPLSIYLGYLRAVGSPTLIVGMLASFVVANGAQFFQQFTVSKWTEVARSSSMSAALGGQYLQRLVYAAGVVSVFLWLRSYFTMLVGLRASAYYHNKMLSSVFRSPMSFFDATPSGQILSRFGKELETVDRALPESIASVLFCVLQIVSSVLALSGAITPAMMVPLAFAGSQYVRIMRKFRPAARDMKRSEQRTRSPIFTNFGEALRGTEVIRSIPGAKRTWSAKHRTLADANLSAFATVKALDRWLSISLEAIGNSMVLITGVASVFLTRAGKLQSGAAGWGLTQSLAITGLMAWAVRNLTMLESHMMSVMRVTELTDIAAEEADKRGDGSKTEHERHSHMPKEMEKAGEPLKADFPQSLESVSVAPLDDRALVADGWPWQGGVSFNNVSMRYNPASPLVLKGVTVSVPPGSTLGVVGRTGSGKSSLLLLLFRIVEIESGGSIEIDGVDIRSVSLETLRDSLAIIPQDPVLFAGTLAFNLDATGKATPDEMWTALEAASPDLVKMFSGTGGLASQISEGGGNLSQGQRQLICLARALLKKSKILVLDEATSSVDAQTDQQVQDTIRKQFVDKGVSVITVAHRLDTVLGYDKIAVLGDGALLEYGAPKDLLKIRNGELRNLVDADRVNKRKGGKPAMEPLAVGV